MGKRAYFVVGLGQGRFAAGLYMAPGIVQRETRFVGRKAAGAVVAAGEDTVGKSKSFVVEAVAGAAGGRIRKTVVVQEAEHFSTLHIDPLHG